MTFTIHTHKLIQQFRDNWGRGVPQRILGEVRGMLAGRSEPRGGVPEHGDELVPKLQHLVKALLFDAPQCGATQEG